jgi:hypothetical protein
MIDLKYSTLLNNTEIKIQETDQNYLVFDRVNAM